MPRAPQPPGPGRRASPRRPLIIVAVCLTAVIVFVVLVLTLHGSPQGGLVGAGSAPPSTSGADQNDPLFVCTVEVSDEIQLQNDAAFAGDEDIRSIVASTSQSEALSQALAHMDLTANNAITDAASLACEQAHNPLLTSEEVQQLVQVASTNSDTGVVNDLQSIHRFG